MFGGIYGAGIRVVCGALNGATLVVLRLHRPGPPCTAPAVTGLLSAGVGYFLTVADHLGEQSAAGFPLALTAAFGLAGAVGGLVVTRKDVRG